VILFEYLTFATTIFSANYFEMSLAISYGEVSKLTPFFIDPSGNIILIG
jgi:hypothetical protein